MFLNYFAYGSNMSAPRLAARVPGLEVLTVGRLAGYALCWHKPGRDGSGKCDIVRSSGHDVYGVVYRLPQQAKPILDRYEGLGVGYHGREVVLDCGGDSLSAFTYVAAVTERGLKPFSWYKHHTLFGARQRLLPEFYIEQICRVDSMTDPDSERHRRELAIYSEAELQELNRGGAA
ncbi:gamma-glutamylcyclotransferase family protein [Marinobacterium jannaschii]|uniref:gamma-glutamylcyclotransferase family protein n=1 Tax=Marinobacterium jannaschii TaxID=64970 RepID=UPI00055BB08B|nr:gamma-glutamylcyclotransferase family protein [Marinobacterium jannaschii]